MSEHSFTVLWLSILVLGMFYLSFAWRLSYLKARRQFNARTQAEGFAGKYLKDYKPRTTIHSIVNMLFVRPALIPDQTAVLAVSEFSDVSFWQGEIDWVKMQTKADKVIIRAGQNSWVDVRFFRNYSESKRVGMQRGVYFFHDGRASPGAQARLLVNLIRDDKPELGVWIDYEHNYGGAWEGLGNVVAMMQEVERLLPGVEVGLYTGFYFFTENSNPILHRSQYAYLKTKRLWLAWYGSSPRIPAPWTAMKYHQFGTPAVGRAWGAGSEELDMNFDMDPDDGTGGDPDPTPIPPIENGETMQYRFTYSPLTTERTGPSVTATETGTRYVPGDIVNVVEIISVPPADKWFKLDNGKYAAYIYNGTTRAELVPVTPPAPVPGDAVTVSIDMDVTATFAGKQYAARVQVADVVMVES